MCFCCLNLNSTRKRVNQVDSRWNRCLALTLRWLGAWQHRPESFSLKCQQDWISTTTTRIWFPSKITVWGRQPITWGHQRLAATWAPLVPRGPQSRNWHRSIVSCKEADKRATYHRCRRRFWWELFDVHLRRPREHAHVLQLRVWAWPAANLPAPQPPPHLIRPVLPRRRLPRGIAAAGSAVIKPLAMWRQPQHTRHKMTE